MTKRRRFGFWFGSKKTKLRGDRPVKLRTLKSQVFVGRTGLGGSDAFSACVYVGNQKAGQGHCAEGRNPRAALASAFRLAASKTAGRSGAFAGLRRKRRKRRR
jgi:hypothetical protein